MTFRDDHDAALARADALEREAEQAKSERDALAERVKQLEAERDTARKRDAKKPAAAKPRRRQGSSAGAGKRTVWLFVGLAVGAFAIMMTCVVVRTRRHDREVAAWQAKGKARTAHRERWSALTSVEPCVRDVAYDAVMVRRNTPDKADPRKAYIWPFAKRLVSNCLHGAKALVNDSKTTPVVRDALKAWLAVQAEIETPANALAEYYDNNDWKEDNFAGAQTRWEPVLALLARQVDAIARVRAEVFPAIGTEVRALQRAHGDKVGQDEIWWRVEIALMFRAISDRAYDVGGVYAGRESDDAAATAAVHDDVVALLAAVGRAPLQIRRIVRKIDYITGPIAAGQTLGGETPLWHLAQFDRDLIGPAQSQFVPALPPDPGKRPPDTDWD